MYIVYFFRYETVYKKELAQEFKNAGTLFANEKFLQLRGEVLLENFDFYRDAIRFKETMPPNMEFFCITDSDYRYILESDACKEMRKAYKPLQHAISLTQIMSYCIEQNRQHMYN